MVGLLTLILLIPLELVKNLIRERAQRQSEVINEINSKWGQEVFVYGPILKVPYTTYTKSEIYDKNTDTTLTERTAQQQYAYFFPEELKSKSKVETEFKYRNNYETVVFTAQMDFTGIYIKPDFSPQNIPDQDIQWDKATILIRTSNQSSIRDVSVNIGSDNFVFEPVYESSNTNDDMVINNKGNYPKYNKISSLETPFIDY